jgi:hypothetical protein
MKYRILFFVCIISYNLCKAQNNKFEARVFDNSNGIEIMGAFIMQDNKLLAVSKHDGSFVATFDAASSKPIEISFLGYIKKEIDIKGLSNADVFLEKRKPKTNAVKVKDENPFSK